MNEGPDGNKAKLYIKNMATSWVVEQIPYACQVEYYGIIMYD